jgi:hypothetical protein
MGRSARVKIFVSGHDGYIGSMTGRLYAVEWLDPGLRRRAWP